MTQLTGPELAALWTINGGRVQAAETWAGIAVSQSSGVTSAVYNTKYPNLPGYSPPIGNNSPEYSIGPWQINQVAHPQYSPQFLMDANNNAKAAIAVSNNGTDLSPWNTDPVADAAMAAGGYANLTQINNALATEGKSYGSGSGTLPGNLNSGASSGTSSTGGGCSDPTSMSFTLHRKGGCCSNVYAINASPFHLISECQADALLGGLIMVSGAIVALAGIAVTLASVGLRGPVAAGVARVPGVGTVVGAGTSAARKTKVAPQASEAKITEAEQRAAAKRYGNAKPKSFTLQEGDDEPL
jgi:hypothetical protein